MTGSIRRASPLALWSERFAQASRSAAHVTLRELPFIAQINLRGDPAHQPFMTQSALVLGCAPPVIANQFASAERSAILWLGPDEWLVVANEDRNLEIESALRAALRGLHHAVTDVSANRTVIEISGSDARTVLAKGCALDLHGTRFRNPQVAQTLLAKAQVILQCTDDRPQFRIFVRNSLASYVAQWLVDAAGECAASRTVGADSIAPHLN